MLQMPSGGRQNTENSQLITAATVCLVVFGILAIVDGVYYHDIKYKLYQDKESILEHIYHTIRAVMFPIMMYCLFAYDFGGVLMIVGIGAVSIDFIMLIFDVKEEGRSRNRYGGLSNGEYMNHVFANTFHFVAIALILAAKPAAAWTIDPSFALGRPYPQVTAWLGSAFVAGGVIAALLHFWQWSQYFSRKVAQS